MLGVGERFLTIGSGRRLPLLERRRVAYANGGATLIEFVPQSRAQTACRRGFSYARWS